MVIVNRLSTYIKGKKILDAISLTLQSGNIHCFIGKSGAGKTTLLKSIAGLIPTTQGEIHLNNSSMNSLNPYQRAENIGYVFQDFNLFAHLTALENCIDPLLVHGRSYEQAKQQALTLLQAFEMDQWRDAYPAQLSGGQQQRIAIARALSLQPQTIVLDEPTASLDPNNTDRLAVLVRSLADQGLTVILSSQDMSFVKKVADCIYYVEDGKVVEACCDIKAIGNYPQISRWLYEA